MSHPTGTWRTTVTTTDEDGWVSGPLGIGYGKTKRESRENAADSIEASLREASDWYGALRVSEDVRDTTRTKIARNYRADSIRIEDGDWDAIN